MREGRIVIPERVERLFSDTTYVLLNKTDLFPTEETDLVMRTIRERFPVWAVSLAMGSRLEGFLDEFGRALNDKCVLLSDSVLSRGC